MIFGNTWIYFPLRQPGALPVLKSDLLGWFNALGSEGGDSKKFPFCDIFVC